MPAPKPEEISTLTRLLEAANVRVVARVGA